jgi:hypothetical protein
MPVPLDKMRDLLLPGLWEITAINRTPVDRWSAYEPAIEAPHIWVPKLSLPAAVAIGAAAAIIKNPTITRRFWAGWNL